MHVADVREVFETILPAETLRDAVASAGLQERERKLDALKLLRAMVLAASTGYGGRQADVLRLYLEAGAKRVVRGSFYAWFGPALEAAMAALRTQALAYVARHSPDLPGWLGRYVRDWHIVDSSTVKLDDRLKAEYPGTGDYAALKIHKRYSLGIGTAVDYHLSPAREHDSPHLVIDESWAGLGLLADLGYASLRLLRDCEHYGVHYVIRLKESWKPRVQRVVRGTLTDTFAPGVDFDLLLEQEILALDGRVIDVRVQLGKQGLSCRLLGVPTPQGYNFYLSNLPAAVGPRQIADLYRVRWEIESDNKLDKSCLHLSEIGAYTGPAVRSLVHASMLGSIMIGMLVHHHRRRGRPPKPGTERKQAPLHAQTLARAVGSAANSIAEALGIEGEAAHARWRELTEYLSHLGRDPNWRSRPSILDQLRGWKITPGSPRKLKTASNVVLKA